MADRAVIGVADWKRTKSDLRRLAKALDAAMRRRRDRINLMQCRMGIGAIGVAFTSDRSRNPRGGGRSSDKLDKHDQEALRRTINAFFAEGVNPCRIVTR